jgi:flagellar basal-body rod modification protein FlgD
MSTNPILPAATTIAQAAEQSKGRTTDKTLDVNDFLKLLIAQISNQDPMGGSSSGGGGGGTDYIAQLAQFTMLQQISSLSSDISSSQAYSLIGKHVYINESPDSEMIFGKVDGVVKEGGINYLMIGGEMYEMSKVYAVAGDYEDSQSIEDEVLKSAYLVGKQVTAQITNDEGVESTVSGKVEKINIKDGVIYLVIGGSDVKLSDITEISEAQPAEQTE